MENTHTRPSQQTIANAERLLAQAFGGSIRLDEGADLGGSGRSGVYRFKVLDGPAAAPATVIVKQPRSTIEAPDDPGSASIPAWTFNEWASLQFLDQIAPDTAFGPRFYGGDRATGLIAFEDLGTGKRLDQFLLDTDPAAAENALIEFAAAHGRMQARSTGRDAEFARIRDALDPRTEKGEYYDYEQYEWLSPTLHKTAELLAIAPAAGIDSELAALRTAILHPGPFLTFIQRDSCPDNCLYTPSGIRLLDFEGGMFAHALLQGVYGRIHFPTCWCVYRMPEHIPLRMEAAYRAELAKGCQAAADDTLFYRAVVEACALWFLDDYYWIPLSTLLEKDRIIVAATERQRVMLRAEIVAQITEQFGHLEALGATARAIATKLRALWPETEEMELYPAFRHEH
jgi:hypothetical protein